jgi:hypothetical protein
MAHKQERTPKTTTPDAPHARPEKWGDDGMLIGDTQIPDKEHRDDKHVTTLKKKIGVGVALLAVGGAAALGIGKATGGGNEDAPISPDSTASAPAEPGETENVETAPLTPEQVAELAPKPTPLTLEQYGTDGDALVRAYMVQFNDWMTANATQEASDAWGSEMLEAFVAKINKPVDDAYVEALFVSDWREHPRLVQVIDSYREGHAAGVRGNLMTTDSYNDADLEPYVYGWNLMDVKVHSASRDEIVAAYRWEGWDNAHRNRGDTIFTEGSFDGKAGGASLTWTNEDGVWKIVDHQYYAG